MKFEWQFTTKFTEGVGLVVYPEAITLDGLRFTREAPAPLAPSQAPTHYAVGLGLKFTDGEKGKVVGMMQAGFTGFIVVAVDLSFSEKLRTIRLCGNNNYEIYPEIHGVEVLA